jgi:TolB-like protein/DNA-binding winged helix-turn-helix (wHTH) protein
MSSLLTVIYEFDRFRVDRANQRLTRDGLLVATPGKTLPLLLALIQDRDQVVSVEKLVDSVFAKVPFGEEELIGEVLKLKRLLDDTSKHAPIVRIVSGKGYQFDAEVTEYLGDSASDSQFGNKPPEAEPDHPFSKTPLPKKEGVGILGISVAVILVVAIGIAVWRFMPTRISGSKGSPQVAILPFQSLTGAANDDSFNKSLTEAIFSALAKQSQVQVVPESSVQHYLESGVADPVTAGHELGAQMIVRGMAQRLAGHILVKVQLINAEDGSQIWSKGFDGDSSDIAGLSTKISEKIGKGMAGAESEQH